jgi:hypothetical protein
MSIRATIGWWVAAAALAAVAWWLGRTPVSATMGPRPLFAAGELPVDRIEAIEIERPDETMLRFERREGRWWQTAPFEHPMDPVSMRRHATAAEGLRTSREVEIDDAAALGLDPPLGRVTFEWRTDGEPRSAALDLGRRGVAGRAWIRRDGESSAHAVDAALHDRVLDGEPRSWRRRRLLDAPEEGIDRITIELVGAPSVAIERTGRRWALAAPFRTRLDAVAMDEWIAALSRVEAAAFFDDEVEDPATYGLDRPAETLVLERRVVSPDGEVSWLREALEIGSLFGPGSTDRFARIAGRPTVVLLAEGSRAAALRPLASLIDPTGSGAVPEEVGMLEIRRGDAAFRIRRELDGFVAESLDERGEVVDAVPCDAALANALLDALLETRAPEISITPFPAELSEALVILEDISGRPLDTVRVAREPDRGRWALENGDDVLRIFPESFTLDLDPAAYGLVPASDGTP